MLLILLMLKGSKEALTVLIVTHATHVKRVESSVCGFYTNTVYRGMLLILLMSKEALTVLIVTHATHVKRVESSVCGFYTTLYTE